MKLLTSTVVVILCGSGCLASEPVASDLAEDEGTESTSTTDESLQALRCHQPDYFIPPEWNAHVNNAIDPLNLILSGNSDLAISDFIQLLGQDPSGWNVVSPGLNFLQGQCINPVQVSVNAGAAAVDQQFAMRPNGCDPQLLFSQRQGNPLQNHFRAWPQQASGAWFLAVSEEHFCPVSFPPRLAHCIDRNGFNTGRNDLVRRVAMLAAQRGMQIASGACEEPIPAAGCLAIGQGPRPPGQNQDRIPFDAFVSVLTFKFPGATQPLPAGSYRSSCSSCEFDSNGTLSCICNDMEGSTVSASLNACECDASSDILNCNGQLSCGSCQLPAGSYQDSCTSCFARVDRLTCGACRRIDGTDSSLPGLSLPCEGDITNCDGQLRCGGC